MITITTTNGARLDGDELINDAYAAIVTELAPENADGWVPSGDITDWDLENAISDTAADTMDYTGALLAMIQTGYLENDPIWDEIEQAAKRALLAFAEEMDDEAERQGLLEAEEF